MRKSTGKENNKSNLATKNMRLLQGKPLYRYKIAIHSL